jgi:hypothetical protein
MHFEDRFHFEREASWQFRYANSRTSMTAILAKQIEEQVRRTIDDRELAIEAWSAVYVTGDLKDATDSAQVSQDNLCRRKNAQCSFPGELIPNLLREFRANLSCGVYASHG